MNDRGDARKELRGSLRQKYDARKEDSPGKKDFSTRKQSREDSLEELMELDGEIIHLVMKRTQLLARFIKNGRIPPEKEKLLRTSWETRAARMGRDSRLSRELFVLLQSIEPYTRPADGRGYFNLVPCHDPVDINMPVPASSAHALLLLAASVACGQHVDLHGICLTDEIIDSIRALNLLGGRISWKDNGDVASEACGGIGTNFDKILHIGGSCLLLYLVLGLCAGQTCHAKITGDNSLIMDLSCIRRFLPSIGVRLTNVVPSQKGLPVRIECSGMIPQRASLSDDLPRDFCAAIIFCSAFWEDSCVFDLTHCNDLSFLNMADEMLEVCGMRLLKKENETMAAKQQSALPQSPKLPVDAVVASSLLMLPGFNGGSVTLKGMWGKGRAYALAQDIMHGAGLDVSYGANETVCIGKIRETIAPSQELLKNVVEQCPDLLPICAVVMAAAVLEGEPVVLTLPDGDDRFTLTHFLSHCGITEENGMLRAAESVEAQRDSWIAPSPAWAMAFALCSFLMPSLRLSNPNIVSLRYPKFWSVYNGLPKPHREESEEKEEKENAAPVRRRVIAKGVYGELPTPIAEDDI